MVRIAVMLFTHRRPFYAERTILSLTKHLRNVETHVHIADDNSDIEDVEALAETARKQPTVERVTISHAGGRGYGGSYNLATNTVHQLEGIDALLPLEDDWELTRPWDPSPYVHALRDGVARSVRLGYVGITGTLDMRTRTHAGRIYLEFHPRSSEPHVFAGHPRLETVAYQRDVGTWPEGIDPGSTEMTVAKRDSARKGVVWPGDLPLTGGLFAHIGTLQAREDQRPAEAVAE